MVAVEMSDECSDGCAGGRRWDDRRPLHAARGVAERGVERRRVKQGVDDKRCAVVLKFDARPAEPCVPHPPCSSQSCLWLSGLALYQTIVRYMTIDRQINSSLR